MIDMFERFQTGLMTGQAQADRRRTRTAQEAAASMLRKGNTTGASHALMAAGLYGDAATMSDVERANRRGDARRAAGAGWMTNPRAAAEAMLSAGELEDGRQLYGDALRREAGSALAEDDPRRAAAVAAVGGDVDMATQLIDWSDRADARERDEAMGRARVMAPILASLGSVPYEQRRAAIQAQSSALGGAGFTPDQIASFDPTDQNIRALTDSVLGIEKVLGAYSMREVGDEVRTYRSTPYGVEQVGAEAVPYTRADARADRGLEMEGERLAIARESAARANSAGDVLGPLLQRYSAGEPLNAQETEIVRSYLDGRQGSAWGMPQVPSAPPAPTPTQPRMPPAGGAQPPYNQGGGGSQQSPARPQTDEDYARLPAGAYFIDPGDGQLYRK